MSGGKGVQAKTRRQKLSWPYLKPIGKRLELAMLDAVKYDYYLTEFKEIINSIFLMY